MRIRVTFSKQGPVRYTGHIDLQKLWERAARRAGLSLTYSKGFHPQPRLSLASALPLGFSSRCEVVDMTLRETVPTEGLAARLEAVLPSGLRVLAVETVDHDAPPLQTELVSAEFEADLPDSAGRADTLQRVQQLLSTKSLPRERRGKAYDLRPLVESLEVAEADGQTAAVTLRMRLAAREAATGRPEEVLDAMGIPAEGVRVERTRLVFRAPPDHGAAIQTSQGNDSRRD